jgi:hypothetical protein
LKPFPGWRFRGQWVGIQHCIGTQLREVLEFILGREFSAATERSPASRAAVRKGNYYFELSAIFIALAFTFQAEEWFLFR